MKKGYINDGKFYVSHLKRCSYNFAAIPIELLEKIGLKPGDPIEIRTYKDRLSIRKGEVNE